MVVSCNDIAASSLCLMASQSKHHVHTKNCETIYCWHCQYRLLALFSFFFYGAVLTPVYNCSDYTCLYPTLAPEYNFFRDFIWTWIDALIFSMLPFAILISSNSVLIWKVSDSVRRARATVASGQCDQLSSRIKKVSSLTVTLFVVSVVFFLLTCPMAFYLIIAPLVTDKQKQREKEFRITELIYWLLTLMWDSNSAV